MGLTNKLFAYLIIALILIVCGAAAIRTSYVDNYFSLHNLLNISNISISGIFSDGHINISNGSITGADTINATDFYQGGNPVVDTSMIANLSTNYSSFSNSTSYWQDANSILAKWFNVVANVFRFNETGLNLTIDDKVGKANKSSTDYTDAANQSSVDHTNALIDNVTTNLGLANESVVAHADSQDDDLRAGIFGNVSASNTSLKAVLDSQIDNVTTNIGLANKSSTDYTDAANQSSVAHTNALIDNVTTNLGLANKSSTDYTDASNASIVSWAIGRFFELTGIADYWNMSAGGLGWENLTDYPDACPANTYVSTLEDSVTCTGVADIYAYNDGDNLTGNYNMTGNITRDDHFYDCYGDDCDGYIYYNGSSLVIKVN